VEREMNLGKKLKIKNVYTFSSMKVPACQWSIRPLERAVFA
jgi:hypothetical protein